MKFLTILSLVPVCYGASRKRTFDQVEFTTQNTEVGFEEDDSGEPFSFRSAVVDLLVKNIDITPAEAADKLTRSLGVPVFQDHARGIVSNERAFMKVPMWFHEVIASLPVGPDVYATALLRLSYELKINGAWDAKPKRVAAFWRSICVEDQDCREDASGNFMVLSARGKVKYALMVQLEMKDEWLKTTPNRQCRARGIELMGNDLSRSTKSVIIEAQVMDSHCFLRATDVEKIRTLYRTFLGFPAKLYSVLEQASKIPITQRHEVIGSHCDRISRGRPHNMRTFCTVQFEIWILICFKSEQAGQVTCPLNEAGDMHIIPAASHKYVVARAKRFLMTGQ